MNDILHDIFNGETKFFDDKIIINGKIIKNKNGVYRFREDDGYNKSFSLQWNKFKKEQYDSENKTDLSLVRFKETKWNLENIKDKLVLEAGCGAGRFSEIFAKQEANLITFDYSNAVDACYENNKKYKNVLFFQCDILDLPFKKNIFDYVFCHGVLQHTSNPKKSFLELISMLKPGGKISVDIYLKDGLIRPWKSKYIWRPLTTRVSNEKLLKFLEWFIPIWLPIDTFIKSIPYIGNYLGSIIPCWNYMNTNLSGEEKVQWAIMDTFDALAPVYDIPATITEFSNWFELNELENIDIHYGGNGLVGNATKKIK